MAISAYQKTLDKEAKLLALTNKFLKDFNKVANDKDELFNFHYTLATMISKSDYPRYEELDSCLLGMSAFDTNITKAFFNERIQGFCEVIENLIESGRNDDDYVIGKVKYESGTKIVDDFKFTRDLSDFKILKKEIKTETISFTLKNNRNNFKGSVKIFKQEGKKFINDNDFETGIYLDEICFYNSSNELIMKIRKRFNDSDEGEIIHFKHIADINSFFILLNSI